MQIYVSHEQYDGKYEKRQGFLRAMQGFLRETEMILRTPKQVRKLLQGFAADVGFEMQIH